MKDNKRKQLSFDTNSFVELETKMKSYDMIGKKIRILFQDLEKSNSKIGVAISQDNEFIQIKKDNNQIEFIPISKVIRIEVLSENAI